MKTDDEVLLLPLSDHPDRMHNETGDVSIVR
jgi:hypothetical protein